MNKVKIISENEVQEIMKDNWAEGLDIIKDSFIAREKERVILPEKTSQIFDKESSNRINCMPSTLIDEKICGVKWVSVFPTNYKKNIENVSGVTIISEIETGKPISIMSSTWLTKYRTAGVAVLASKYLSIENNSSIGFIGAGEEAKMHFELFKLIYPDIKVCRVSSRTEKTCEKFIDDFSTEYPDVQFINCGNDSEKAIKGSDVIVTAISGQEPVLKADWIDQANFYVHVGGYEDEYKVALMSSKIVCDEWQAVKHRGSQTLSKMYRDGIIDDSNIYADLSEIIVGNKSGRTSDDSLIYFNSVGMSYVDVLLAKFVYDNSKDLGKVLYL